MATPPQTASATSATGIETAMVQALLSTTQQVTNLTPGGVIRGTFDSVAQQIAALQQQQGTLFSATANSVGAALYQVPPVPALGSTYTLQWSLAASAPASVTLAQGTLAAVPSTALQWATTQTLTVAPGTSGTVNATATTTGTVTNVPAASITQVVQPIAGLTVTNPSAQPTQAGRDAETPTALQARIQNRVAQNQRGTKNACAAGALLTTLTDGSGAVTEQVLKAQAVTFLPTAAYPTVNAWCYVYNGVGPASATLLSTAQGIVDTGYTDANGTAQPGFKSAGVFVTVADAPEVTQAVSATVTLAPGYTWATVQSAVQTAIQTWITALDLGSAWVNSSLLQAILAVPGVADAVLTTPSGNLPGPLYAPNPTQAPSLTATSPSPATDLAAGTYTVAVAYQTPAGLTLASPTAPVTIAAGQAIQVAVGTLPPGVSPTNTAVAYYLSEAAGSSTILLATTTSATTTTLTTLPANGSPAPLSTSTAQIQGWAWIAGTITITPAG